MAARAALEFSQESNPPGGAPALLSVISMSSEALTVASRPAPQQPWSPPVPAYQPVPPPEVDPNANNNASGSGYIVRRSVLGQKLSEAITLKVIVLTLLMLVILPQTFVQYQAVSVDPLTKYTKWIHDQLATTQISDLGMLLLLPCDRPHSFYFLLGESAMVDQFVQDMAEQPAFYGQNLVGAPSTYLLLYLRCDPSPPGMLPGPIVDHSGYRSTLRSDVVHEVYFSTIVNETDPVTGSQQTVTYVTEAAFNMNPLLRSTAIYSIFTRLVICVLYVGTSLPL